MQKKYYRAIYEKNLTFLRQGVSRANMPRLVNMEIELRKVCHIAPTHLPPLPRSSYSLHDSSIPLYRCFHRFASILG